MATAAAMNEHRLGESPNAVEAGEPLVILQDHRPQSICYGVPVGDYREPLVPQPYVLPPLLSRHRGRLRLRLRLRPRLRCPPPCCNAFASFISLLALFAAALLIGAAIFFLWPSDPQVRLSWLGVRSIRAVPNRHGGIAVDVDMDLRVYIYNRDFLPLDYDNITVDITYRGQPLGTKVAVGPRLESRGESYVDAWVRLDGIWVLQDTSFLLEDIAKGRIPLDTTTLMQGRIHLHSMDFPVEVIYLLPVSAARLPRSKSSCPVPLFVAFFPFRV